jgi:site-specific DNA-methyltransferase (adenine-specific)
MNDLEICGATVLLGDCIERLNGVPERSVQMCVTSPPYYGLRDYGHNGQIGLEETPDAYIAKMVGVFREVHRVLADDGTLWLNIGDSYATRPNGPLGTANDDKADYRRSNARRSVRLPPGIKHKDLIGIPWMLAFALRADGWYLRQDIIWHKPNPMPESVRDRCTKAHEYMFLLSKSERYFFDGEAVKEPAVGGQSSGASSFKRPAGNKREQAIPGQSMGTHRPDRPDIEYNGETRNRRSVWTVATRPYKGAHFAVFPPALVEPCILAGSRPGDVVLDPFNGSGTTGQIAIEHGRRYVGIELNPEYVALTRTRLEGVIAAKAAAPSPQSDLFAAA